MLICGPILVPRLSLLRTYSCSAPVAIADLFLFRACRYCGPILVPRQALP